MGTSEGAKKRWAAIKANPERYAQVLENHRNAALVAHKKPEVKAKHIAANAKPERKKQRSELRSRMNKTKKHKATMKIVNADPVRAAKISKSRKMQWRSKEFRDRVIPNMIFTRHGNKPNSLEKKFLKLLTKTFGLKYKFVGNGAVMVCGNNPDFVHRRFKRQIIELNGSYYHSKPEQKIIDQKKQARYKKGNYRCLVIWDYELDDLKSLRQKIRNFHSSRSV